MPNPLLAAAISLYLILGSMSIGYLLLRTGWPKVRILEISYKLGWSIVLGAVFSVFVIISSFAISLGGLSYEGLLFAGSGIFLGIVSLALTVRRKFFAGGVMRVAVPKELVGANIAAAKVAERFRAREDYLDMDSMEEGRKQAVVDKLRSLIRKGGEKERMFESAYPAGSAVGEELPPGEDEAGIPLIKKPPRESDEEEEGFGGDGGEEAYEGEETYEEESEVKAITEEDLEEKIPGADAEKIEEEPWEDELPAGEAEVPLGLEEETGEEVPAAPAPAEREGTAGEKASILGELEKKLAAAQEKEEEDERKAAGPGDARQAETAPAEAGSEKKKPAVLETKKEPGRKGGGIFAALKGIVPKGKPKGEGKKTEETKQGKNPEKEITDEEAAKKLGERISGRVAAAKESGPASWAAEAPEVGKAGGETAPVEKDGEEKERVDRLKKLLRGIK